ncbi:MAG: ABC transporter ATP-binding protein [Nitrospinota bacterium]
MALLTVENLEVAYGEVQVVWGADLTVEEGSITGLIGGNGAGKTTTLKAIAGLKKSKGGEIRLAGERIAQLSSHRVIEKGISLILEGGRPFPEMTVRENLEMGSYVKSARPKTEESKRRVFDLFPILAERQNQVAGTLSGGERQMLAISRGLMSDPKILMLDEPSLGLAPKIVEQMFGVIQDLNRKGMTVLLVEQNIQHTLQISHRNYVMETGRIVLEGGPELRDNEHIKKAYLGL